MATLYGSAVSSTANPPQSVNQNGFAHARMRKLYSTYEGQPTTSDTLIIGLFKPSDRIFDIKFYTDGAGTNGALNIGVHRVTIQNGAISLTAVDADVFATAKATGTAILHGSATATVFTESGNFVDVERGKALWQLASDVTGTYTSDPGGLLAITATPSTSEDAASDYAFEIEYVAGD